MVGIYYKAKKINGRKKDVHRLVMAQHLGRDLLRSEVVHHIDGNIENNDIKNLMLFPSLSAHTRFHQFRGDLKLIAGNNKKELVNGKLQCSKCGEYKELSEFQKQSQAHLGVMGVCKICRNLQVKKWKKAHE